MAETDTLPNCVKDLVNFLTSEPTFLTLSNLTGLSLHPIAAENIGETSPAEEASFSGETSSGEVPPKKRKQDYPCTSNG